MRSYKTVRNAHLSEQYRNVRGTQLIPSATVHNPVRKVVSQNCNNNKTHAKIAAKQIIIIISASYLPPATHRPSPHHPRIYVLPLVNFHRSRHTLRRYSWSRSNFRHRRLRRCAPNPHVSDFIFKAVPFTTDTHFV